TTPTRMRVYPMSFLRGLFAASFFALHCFAAIAADAPPPEQAVQESLDALAERQLPETEKTQARQALEQTLTYLQEQAATEQRLKQLALRLQQAPQQIEQARRELAELQPLAPLAQEQAERTPQELEQLLAERSAQLNDWQQQIIEANSLVINAQTRPE